MERNRPGRPATRRAEDDHPQRVMPGQGNKLAVKYNLPGFRLYWALDEPGRLEEMQQYGYTFVEDNALAEGGRDSSEAVQQGNKVTRPAGNGRTFYLMKIRADWHQENYAYQQAQVDEVEQTIGRAKGPNQYAPKWNGREIDGVQADTE